MPRIICNRCQRPEKVCVCDLVPSIANQVEIGIMQHPTEVKQVKGTAILAKLGLKKSQMWEAELISQSSELQKWLADNKPIYLLYPPSDEDKQANQFTDSISAEELAKSHPQDYKVLVLDGTWRKTYKMMQLNSQLQELPRVTIEFEQASSYQIRKQKNAQSLSTIEAIANLLSCLESDADKYNLLLDAFEKMQKQQLGLRKSSEK